MYSGIDSLLVTVGLEKNAEVDQDPYSRFEAFTVSIVFITLGFILEAVSNNIGTFAAAQIFYVAGQVGIQFMQQIFAAGELEIHSSGQHKPGYAENGVLVLTCT